MNRKTNQRHANINFRPIGNDSQEKAKAQEMFARLVALAQGNDLKQLATWIGVAQTQGVAVNIYNAPGEVEGYWCQESPPCIYINEAHPSVTQCRVMAYLLSRHLQIMDNPDRTAKSLRHGARIKYNRAAVILPGKQSQSTWQSAHKSQAAHGFKPQANEDEVRQAKHIARQIVRFVIDPRNKVVDPELAAIKQLTVGMALSEQEEVVELVMHHLFESGSIKGNERQL